MGLSKVGREGRALVKRVCPQALRGGGERERKELTARPGLSGRLGRHAGAGGEVGGTGSALALRPGKQGGEQAWGRD